MRYLLTLKKKLQQHIPTLSKANLDISDVDFLTTGNWNNLQTLNMVNWPHWVITAGIGFLLIILAAVFLLCLIQFLSSHFLKAHFESHAIHFKNIKGEVP